MRRYISILTLGILFILTGCTLTHNEPPLIIEARPTNTPLSPTNTPTISAQVDVLSLMGQIQEDRLMSHIAALVGMVTRHVNSPQDSNNYGISGAANYIVNQLRTIQNQSNGNFSVFEHPFVATYDGRITQQQNIVGVLQGTQASAGVILIGAHYDSRTWDLRDAEGYAPGADDNASGVAAIIEIARAMSQRPRRATILFVLFSAEEVARQGSIAFVSDYLQAFDIGNVMMLNVDTIGSWNDEQGNINRTDIRLFSAPPNTSQSRHLARTLNFFGYFFDLDLNIVIQPTIDREGRYGDHHSFEEMGYPAVRYIEAVEDNANREGADTIDHIEPAYLAAATRTILGTLDALADGQLPPINISFRSNADGTASVAWEPVSDATGYVVALRRPNSLIFDRHFIITTNRTEAWDGWWEFETFAIATLDERGMVGRFSTEIPIQR
jgi:hypothetical protein